MSEEARVELRPAAADAYTVRLFLSATTLLGERIESPARRTLKYPSVEAMVLELGLAYTPQPYPRRWRRGRPMRCFGNAYDLMTRITSRELTYVEGFGWSGHIVTMHGWCVDADGLVYDPTWDEPERCEYLGIPIPRDEIPGRLRLARATLPLLGDFAADRYLRDGWELE